VTDPPSGNETVIAFGRELGSANTVVGDPIANGATVQIIANRTGDQDATFTLPAGLALPGGAGWRSICNGCGNAAAEAGCPASTRCCAGASFGCADLPAATAPAGACSAVLGTLAPAGEVCDPASSACQPAATAVTNCCDDAFGQGQCLEGTAPESLCTTMSGTFHAGARCGLDGTCQYCGRFFAKWGSAGSANGQFNLPFGVAVDASGNVYVADAQNHRIQRFDCPDPGLPVITTTTTTTTTLPSCPVLGNACGSCGDGGWILYVPTVQNVCVSIGSCVAGCPGGTDAECGGGQICTTIGFGNLCCGACP
jgi:hypothetical protein